MFVHLAAKTCYSLRDGVIRPRELARATAEMGMDAVGFADRGGMYGAVRMAQACAAEGVRPIFGADLALYPEPWADVAEGTGRPRPRRRGVAADLYRPGWGIQRASRGGIGRAMGPGSGQGWLENDAARVTIIARDETGYATLNRTVTDHQMESERGDPHLTWAQIVHRLGAGADPGVFVMLGTSSPVGRLIADGRHDAARAECERWRQLIGSDNLLLGVTHHLAPGDDAIARGTFALADALGLRAVADQAPRYLRPHDARIADVMDAVRQQVPLSPTGLAGGSSGAGGTTARAPVLRQRRNAEGYLKTGEEMARVFAERPDALANAGWVAEQCHVDIGLGRLRVPDFVDGPAGSGAEGWPLEELRRRCTSGINERFEHPTSRHWDLLDRELGMVAQLGLAPYFLTVAEIMVRIRSKGILAACRGSAAGSLITYAVRISDVDPIAHNLAFERFMNPYRDELPDIDIDVESARREDIYRDLLDTYGEHRVACVCMVETFKARMAIREVGKALGLPQTEIDYVAKSFPHVRAGDVRAALEHLPELKGSNIGKGQLGLLFDVVEKLDGFPRHIALHPSGVLLADDTLRDNVAMERSADRGPDQPGFAMAQLDKDDVEALGLCKLDVLAVRMLSSMAHAREEVRRTRGVEIDFDDVAFNDGDTYELIRSTRTIGMFQIESPGQRELVGKFQPEHQDDLVVDISLFRPGPVKGDMIKPFLRRRHGEESSGVPHPILEEALGETFGVIVYHEQVMRCVAAVTGCDLAEADLVRRRLGDPTQLPKLEAWVRRGAAERGLPEDVVNWLWVALSQFASFGFCKAHAAAFSVPTYRSAWLKAHALPEFVAGLLTHDPGMYPRRVILDDARQFGVAVLPLDVNASASDYRVEVIRTDEAYDLLGIDPTPGGRMPRGWSRDPVTGDPVPPSGFDKAVAEPGWRYAIRLGLQDVERIDSKMVESLLLGRPFVSLEDLRLRASLSQPVAESLAHAGALDEVGGVGLPTVPAARSGPSASVAPEPRLKTRRDLLLEVSERWSGLKRFSPRKAAEPMQLGLLPPAEAPGLPEYRPSERVRAELEVVGMDASVHVISFYDTLLDTLEITRAVDLLDCRENQRVRIAGVKIATQTPPVKSGQRVIFLSLDDSTGIGDASFFESVHDRCAWTVFHTWLLVVEGRIHRSGRRGVSLTASHAWDLRRLMTAWQQGWLPEALKEQGRPTEQAKRNFTDQAPSESIRGAAGRSGLVLPGREGEHLQMRKTVPYAPAAAAAADQTPGQVEESARRAVPVAYGDPRQARGAIAARAGSTPPTVDPSTPIGDERPLPRPGATLPWDADGTTEVARSSRLGPNGTTWADPAGRHPGVDSQDTKRLSRNDPRHPDYEPEDPRPEPPRKLWHSSPGSAGQ